MLLLVTISFLQRVGETTFDTKLDLTVDPARFLDRSLILWGTRSDFGGIANQGYGYLFPQGPFFLLGHLAHVPAWVVERSWSALVLVVAYDGARRLARAMGVGTVAVPVLVGLVYALSPRIVGLSGVLTGEIVTSAVLPWVCLPLVHALRGRISPRRAALLSALAVVAMGGVNAAENLAALPLPLFLVLSGLGSRPGKKLAAWWVACTTLASLWWTLPLLLLGKYSPPFLDYVESAATTTRTAGWSTTIRGAEHWLGYIVVGPGQWWPAAHAMGAAPALVVLGGLIAAVGLVGLVRRGSPFRGPLLLSLVTGLVAATAGHGGPAGSPYADRVRDLLDGPLAPFRNVHKVDPLVRLPLAIGVGVVCAGIAAAVAAERNRIRPGTRSPWPVRIAGTLAFGLVIGSAAPAFSNELRHPGWDAVPQPWRDAAAWIDHDGPGTTLVLPATGIAQQTWGWTVDEPVQALLDSSWATRSQIPLVPATTIRLLDAIEDRMADGSGSSALAPVLAAAGVTRVLVRNDLDVAAADTADPVRVAAALANSDGLEKEISFGARTAEDLPMLQVYRVAGSTGLPRATTSPLPLLTGAPEDVITAREAGVLDGDAVVARAPNGSAPDIVTDGYRRVERSFGTFHDAVGQVMTYDEPARSTRTRADFSGVPGVPRVVAAYGGIDQVTASSSAGYVDHLGPVRPEEGPASVLDGDPATAWVSAPFTDPVGQSVRISVEDPTPIGRVSVETGGEELGTVPVTRLRIAAGGKHVDVEPDDQGRAEATLDGVRATSVTVSVLAVGSHRRNAQVAIREIAIAGIAASPRLVIPEVGADSGTTFVFSSDAPRRPCIGSPLGRTCDVAAAHPGTEQASLNRDLNVDGTGTWTVRGDAVALPSPATAKLLQPLGTALAATASSVLGDDPSVSGMFAVDGSDETPWLAGLGDLRPSIELTWKKPRTLARLEVVPSVVASLRPYEAVLEAGGQTRTVAVGGDGLGFFDAIAGVTSARITLHAHRGAQGALPVGVGELRLDGLANLAKPVAQSQSFTSACGLGPQLTINAVPHLTSITGTLRDVVEGRPLAWKACGKPIEHLSGLNRVDVGSTGAFSATQVVLTPQGADRLVAPTERAITSASPLASTMRVTLAHGARAVLTFGQNANAGWRASLDGKQLETQVVDGWQQGFVVPAGSAASVKIWFAPSATYRTALAIGAGAVLVVLLLLLLEVLRPAAAAGSATAPRVGAGWYVVGLLVVGALGGPVAGGAALVAALASRRVASGALGVGAGVLVLASAVVAACVDGTASGAPGTAADLLAALGCGVCAGSLWLGRPARRAGAEDPA
ncbi:MAG: alpha-(1-_3)-arabinofuranosyltransferase family protein [Marmoricola sp.]